MLITAYLRWSDQHQSKGSSLSRQTRACVEFAAELEWPIADRIIEDGLSGFSGANLEKGKLGALERRARAGELIGQCLMVEKMDRLTRRDAFDALRWFGDMVESGLTIAIADLKMIVDASSIRNQRAQLKAILDELDKANAYSATLGQRVRAAWQTMRDGKTIIAEHNGTIKAINVVGDRQDVTHVDVARGRKTDTYWLNTLEAPLSVGDTISDGQVLGTLCQKVHAESTCPAWLELIENRTTFRVRPDIAALIVRIFTLYLTTDLGARGIARLLNGEGVATLRDGWCWHGSTVKALLKNRGVLGEYEYAVRRQKNGTVVTDYFPQIVSNELFQAVNDRNLARIKGNHSRTSRLRHLFSDVGRCFKCDTKLTYVTKRQNADGRHDSYAMCQSAYLNTGCDQKRSLRMIPVEDTVLDNILALALDDEHFVDEADLPELRRDLADKNRTLDDIQRRIEALLDLIADPSFRRDERFDLRLRTAQNEETAAKEAVAAASERLSAAKGQVAPHEHIRRVEEIRADLWSDDEAKGLEARRKVKMAINDLVDRFYVSVDHQQAVLVLKRGVRHLVLDWSGALKANIAVDREEPKPSDTPAVRAYFERLAKQKAA